MATHLIRLKGNLKYLFFMLGCLGLALGSAVASSDSWTHLIRSWESLNAGAFLPMNMITYAITAILLTGGTLLGLRWMMGFLLIFLASTATSGTVWHRRLLTGAVRLTPRMARTALVSAAGASLVLTTTPALATESDPGSSMAQPATQGSYLGFATEIPDPPLTPTSPPPESKPTQDEEATPAVQEEQEVSQTPAAEPEPPKEAAASEEPTASEEPAASEESTASATEPEPTKAPVATNPGAETDSPLGTSATQDPPAADRAGLSVTVAEGDSLWSITATLHPSAANPEIAALWPQLYEANRGAIGSEPNLITPGTVLNIPAALDAASTR